MVKCRSEERPPSALWHDARRARLPRASTSPSAYGGRRPGPARARDRPGGAQRGRLPAVAADDLPGVVGTDPHPPRDARAAGPLAARPRRGREHYALALTEPDAGSNSHRICHPRRRTDDGCVLSGDKTYISGLEDASRCLVIAARAIAAERPRARSRCSWSTSTRPGSRPPADRDRRGMPEQQWHALLRRRRGRRGRADRRARATGCGRLRRAEPRAHHRRGDLRVGVGRYALEKAAAYASERAVWGDTPIGAHQGVAHPLAEAQDRARAGAADDPEGRVPPRRRAPRRRGREHGQAARRRRRRCASTRRSRPTAATASPTSTASPTCWFTTRLQRIAPVSREMILNYVAQHSLGLPRSY